MPTKWSASGVILGACSCDWGCPCSFDAPPTQGFCEGGYIWHIKKGKFGDVSLDGLSLSWMLHAPAALHKGNVTSLLIFDEKANPSQRKVLTTLTDGKSGGPWVIFSAVTSKRLGPRYGTFELSLDGLRSKAKVPGILDVELGPILNPVSNEPEELYLDKPTGFTSKRLTLGASKVMRVTSDLKYDHSGKYGEYSAFDYSGESPD